MSQRTSDPGAEPDAASEASAFPAGVFFLFVAIALCAAALLRGIWLDEFWSLILADPAQEADAMASRWAKDAHPILPNILYHLVLRIAGDAIALDRILLNLPALLVFLAASWMFWSRSAAPRAFHIVFAVLLVSLPSFVNGFTEFRSYAWQMCWTGILVQLIHFLTTGRGATRAEPAPRIVGAIAVFVAINLHFVGGVIVSAAVALLLFALARLRARAWMLTLGGAAAAAWLAMLVQAAIQVPNIRQTLDVSWIGTPLTAAVAMFGAAIGMIAIVNPVALLLSIVRRGGAVGAERDFLALVLTAMAASMALLLAANAVKPILIDRYLVSWQVLGCGVVAALSCRAIASSRLHAWLFGGAAALACLAGSIHYARTGAWDLTRDHIAAAVRECPSTSVYAMNPWRVAAPGSRVGAFEGETFAFGYRKLAREAGFEVRMVPDDMTALPVSSECPTLLWIEHSGPDNRAPDVLRAARLSVPAGTRLGMLRGRSGFVLVAQQDAPR